MTIPRTATLAGMLLLRGVAAALDVTECGQTVPPGTVGELRRDLDCVARPQWPFSALGVRLEPGGRLAMNGFAIRGDGTGVGVSCAASGAARRDDCTVEGPGTIAGFEAGVNGAGCRLVLRGLVLRDNRDGVLGPLVCHLDAEDVHAVDNARSGIWVWKLRGRNLEASGNGDAGVLAATVRVQSLLATANGGDGVRQLKIRGRFGCLRDSTVVGNGTDAGGYDIAAAGRLRLRDVRCGRSARLRYPRVVDSSDDVPRVVGSFGCRDD